jgi:uncharacterized protein YeaO (DUF488 family)
MSLDIKRAHDPPGKGDGTRVLVDRLWPRGLTKERAKVDLWLKDIAPSERLRKWFGHDPEKWQGFRVGYLAELRSKADDLAELRALSRKGKVTLLFAAHDAEHNNAVVLKEALAGRKAAA